MTTSPWLVLLATSFVPFGAASASTLRALPRAAAETAPPLLDVHSSGVETTTITFGFSGNQEISRDFVARHVTILQNSNLTAVFSTTDLEPGTDGSRSFVFRGRLSIERREELEATLSRAGIASAAGGCDASRGRLVSVDPTITEGSAWDEVVSWFGAGSARNSFAVSPDFPVTCDDPLLELLALVDDLVDEAAGLSSGQCDAGNDAFMLGEGRFRVDVCWRTPAGESGTGKLSQRDGDGATVWFFQEENPELFVKIKDACRAFGRNWVFLSGLTNVEVTTTVTDVLSEQQRTYFNDLGVAFVPVQDTSSFATCGRP
jgi:hypothetical protein